MSAQYIRDDGTNPDLVRVEDSSEVVTVLSARISGQSMLRCKSQEAITEPLPVSLLEVFEPTIRDTAVFPNPVIRATPERTLANGALVDGDARPRSASFV